MAGAGLALKFRKAGCWSSLGWLLAACGGPPVSELLPVPQPLRWVQQVEGSKEDRPAALVSVWGGDQGGWLAVEADGGLGSDTPEGFYLIRFGESGPADRPLPLDLGAARPLRVRLASGPTGLVVGGSVEGPTGRVGDVVLERVGALDGFLIQGGEAQGGPRWARRFGGSGEVRVETVGADGAGRICAAGAFTGSFTLPAFPTGGEGRVFQSRGGSDLFLACFGPEGRLLLAAGWGGPGDDTVLRSVVVPLFDPGTDPALAGGLSRWVVGGRFEGRLQARDGQVLLESTAPDSVPFVASLDLAPEPGELQPRWIRTLGEGSGRLDLLALDAGPSRLLVAGSLAGGWSVDGTDLEAGGGIDGVLLSFEARGGPRFEAAYLTRGSQQELITGVALLGRDQAWVSGSFRGRLSGPGGEISAGAELAGFLMRLAPGEPGQLEPTDAVRLGQGPGRTTGGLVVPAERAPNEFYGAGVLQERVEFGTSSLTSAGETDVYWFRFGDPLPTSMDVRPGSPP